MDLEGMTAANILSDVVDLYEASVDEAEVTPYDEAGEQYIVDLPIGAYLITIAPYKGDK